MEITKTYLNSYKSVKSSVRAKRPKCPQQRSRYPLLSHPQPTASASESDRVSCHHTRVSLNLWHADRARDRLSRVGKISVRYQCSIETLFFSFHLWNSSLYFSLYYPSSETVFSSHWCSRTEAERFPCITNMREGLELEWP